MTTGGSSIYWDDGTCRQRIINTDDSTANTAVFNFQQSENSGSSWKNLLEIRDNGRLVLTNKTGGIYRVDDGATNEPLIHLSNNNVDSSIMRIDGNGRTSVVNTQSHGFDLKYIGTGEGENNSLDLIADNMDGANITAISVSNNGKIGIGDKFNTNYRLYVNGNSYLKGNNFLYGDLSAFYDGVDQYLQYTAEGTVASHAAKISLYRIIASGKAGTAGTKVPGVQLDAATGMLHLQAAASDPSASAGARIKFTYWNAADSNGQPIYISHSINDSYRAPYGLKIWGSDGSAPGAWLEVEGNLYIGSASNSNSNDNAALYIRGMSAIEGYDTWLRLNDNSSFSSGTLSPKLIRSDEALQVGSGGANFYANSSGNGYIQNTFGVHGTDTTKHFFVNGTSRFADDITMDNGSEILFSPNTQYLRWTTDTSNNNSTGRSWYGIGTYQNTSDSNNSWLNISNYWGINITTKGNTCLRHNNNIIATTGNQTGTVGSATCPIYSSGGVLMASSATVGSGVRGIYLNAGAITAMTYELGANIKSYFGSLSSGGWAALNGKSNAPSIAIAYNNSAASWNSGPYSASLVFGCQDTRGLLDCACDTPIVTFGGCYYGGASNDAPTWYMKLSGTNGKIYTLPTDSKTLCASDGTNASGTWGISISGNAATALTVGQGNDPNVALDANNIIIARGKKTFYVTNTDKMTNRPSGTSWGYLDVGSYDNNGTYMYQTFIDGGNANMYVRVKNNSTWGAWTKILTDANYGNIADNRYVKKSGDTMTGAFNLANGTWNKAGDDAQFGDNNTAGSFAIQGINGDTNLKMVTYGSTSYGTITWNGSQFVFSHTINGNITGNANFATNAGYLNNVSGHGVTITTSSWTNNPWGVSNLTRVWGQCGVKSSLSGDSADITLCYGNHGSSGGAGWYMSIDGGIYCLHGIYGAVWNDYAEFRESTDEQPGRVVMEDSKGICQRTNERLQPFAGIISDTFGFSEGKTDKATTPLAVAGRALAYPYQNRNNYKPGDCVCAAPNGTVDIMTREEVREYPDRIVGTVSEIPEYEEWGTGKVKVDGRIWIKVR